MSEALSQSDASFGIPFESSFANLTLNAQALRYHTGGSIGYAANLAVTPSYSFTLGKVVVKAGVKFGFILRNQSTFCPHDAGLVFPDVNVSYSVLEENLVLFASATGGNRIATYDDLLYRNHFLGSFSFAPDNTVETVNALIGARGNIRERFHFNVKAGFNRLVNAVSWGYSDTSAGYTPIVGYMSPLNTFYADAQVGFMSDNLDIDGTLHYQYTLTPAIEDPIQANLFAPAALTGKARASYKLFGGRFIPSATIEVMSERKSVNATLPAFADLGTECSFGINRYWSAYLRIGNLLNQSVQRVPFHAEKGIYVTAGASVKF